MIQYVSREPTGLDDGFGVCVFFVRCFVGSQRDFKNAQSRCSPPPVIYSLCHMCVCIYMYIVVQLCVVYNRARIIHHDAVAANNEQLISSSIFFFTRGGDPAPNRIYYVCYTHWFTHLLVGWNYIIPDGARVIAGVRICGRVAIMCVCVQRQSRVPCAVPLILCSCFVCLCVLYCIFCVNDYVQVFVISRIAHGNFNTHDDNTIGK